MALVPFTVLKETSTFKWQSEVFMVIYFSSGLSVLEAPAPEE